MLSLAYVPYLPSLTWIYWTSVNEDIISLKQNQNFEMKSKAIR